MKVLEESLGNSCLKFEYHTLIELKIIIWFPSKNRLSALEDFLKASYLKKKNSSYVAENFLRLQKYFLKFRKSEMEFLNQLENI